MGSYSSTEAINVSEPIPTISTIHTEPTEDLVMWVPTTNPDGYVDRILSHPTAAVKNLMFEHGVTQEDAESIICMGGDETIRLSNGFGSV